MTGTPTPQQRALAQLVIGLAVVAVVAGLLMHGLSGEVISRVWQNMLDRPGGPFVFRFVLQPVMATAAAVRHGLNDARSGRPPFFEAIVTDPAGRRRRLEEALYATSRILLLGLAIDTVYQLIEFDAFFPVEALLIAVLLAFLPYVVMRGLVSRIARRLAAQPGR